MRIRTPVTVGALMLVGGISVASAQTIIVEQSPAYAIVAPPVYAPPVVVAPAPHVYVRKAPVYVAPAYPRHRYTREVVITESVPAWSYGAIYPDW